MSDYVKHRQSRLQPRVPLEGSIDLTYRCNNNCLHCWLRIPPDDAGKDTELSASEICDLVDEARKMGCRRWSISGGEPLLRTDFTEVFEYITARSTDYSLNTNGTLITPHIAVLLRRRGNKMVALYGATAEVHDGVTRNPGSFESVVRGCAYLKEAGAGFTVQIVPMKNNYHQHQEMIDLAKTLSPHYRIGASWLFLSACGDPGKNREIRDQRLTAGQAFQLAVPDVTNTDAVEALDAHTYVHDEGDDRLFAPCLAHRRDFHIDAYGAMSFCSFIKDPALRYDLRGGNFEEAWEDFIPSLADEVRGGTEYLENCGSCESRKECRWCPVYGYLEHRRFSARVEYLCDIAGENRHHRENWQRQHRRDFRIAGMTIRVESDVPITSSTFHPKFRPFEVQGSGEDIISIRHHFSIPDIDRAELGEEVYHKPPWAIYRNGQSWVYVGIIPDNEDYVRRVAVFNRDHTRVRIYNPSETFFRRGGVPSLTLFATDQILLARVLADRQACIIHSGGVLVEGKGFLFVGHSDSGKSTMVQMMKSRGTILCDDRMIVRKHPDGHRIHGTWSHGDVPDVNPGPAPLSAIFFLQQSTENRLVAMQDKREPLKRLLACLIKPLETPDWWEKSLGVLEGIIRDIPCYECRFDKSGRIVEILSRL